MGALTWVELLRLLAWVGFGAALIVKAVGVACDPSADPDAVLDQRGLLDHLDVTRLVAGRVASAVVVFCLFLSLLDEPRARTDR